MNATHTRSHFVVMKNLVLLGLLLLGMMTAFVSIPPASAMARWDLTALPPGTPQLTGVAMTGLTDGWAVGLNRALLRWDGSAWSAWVQDPPLVAPPQPHLFSVAAVGADDVWAVGWGWIIHWDGAVWVSVQCPTPLIVSSISMVGANDGWAVGMGGTIMHYAGTDWSLVQSPTTHNLYTISMISSDDGWVVGDGGTILHWDGSSWSNFQSPTSTNLYSLLMTGHTDGWIGGASGALFRWDGASWIAWTQPRYPVADHIYGISMNNPSDVWAVGASGTLLHWNGVRWDDAPNPTTLSLKFISMVDGVDGWAVGGEGSGLAIRDGPTPSVTMTVSYSVAGGGVGYSAPTFKFSQGGVWQEFELTSAQVDYVVDEGTTWSVTPNPLAGSTATEQWYSNDVLSGTAAAGTYSFTFQNQYYLSVSAEQPLGGSVEPASGWADAGATPTITAHPNAEYSFTGWLGSGTGSYTGTDNPAQVTVNEPVSETATFTGTTTSVSVTVKASGLPADVSGAVLNIDGTDYSYNQLPTTFDWTVSSTHTLSATTLFDGPPDGVRYAWTTWSDGEAQSHIITVTGSATYEANYKTQYYLNVYVTEGGAVDVGGGWHDSGETFPLLASPASSDYTFTRWDGTGDGSYTGTENPATVTMNSPITETASFARNAQGTYSLTVTVVGSGVVDLNNTGPYHYGDVVQFTAVPDAGWSLSAWSGDLSGSTNPDSVAIVKDTSVTATFTRNTYTMIFMVIGAGVVNSNNTGPYHYGDVVQLTAVPDADWSFSAWRGDLSGSTNPDVITFNIDRSWCQVTVVFTRNTYSLPVTVIGNGVVNLNNSGPYHYGDVVQLTAVPDADWSFSAWSGDMSGSTNPDTITITGDNPVTATFSQPGTATTVTWALSGASSDVTYTILTIDGVPYAYRDFPHDFQWIAGSMHTIETNTPLHGDSGTQYVFVSHTSTSFGAQLAPSFTYIAPPTPETVTTSYQPGPATVGITVTSDPQVYDYGVLYVDGMPIYPQTTFNWNVGDTHTISAGSTVSWNGGQYAFQSWSDGGDQTHTITVPGTPTTYTATFSPPQTVAITWNISGVGSDAAGTILTIDDSPPLTLTYSDFPHTFLWTAGSVHKVAASTPLIASTDMQYVFVSHNSTSFAAQSGMLGSEFTYVTPSTAETVTTSYSKQYWVTLRIAPAGSGSICAFVAQRGDVRQQNEGAGMMCTANETTSGWADDGSIAQLLAAPFQGYTFSNWSGTGVGAYSGPLNPVTVLRSGPLSMTATFVPTTSSVQITVTSNPAGEGFVSVDGTNITTPHTFSWAPESSHLISAAAQASAGTGVRYLYGSWSDGGSQSHIYTVPSSAQTVTSTFSTTQYYLTVIAETGGTVSPSSGWYDASSTVQLQATPEGSMFHFLTWTGSGNGAYTGASNPVTITMNGPITETASFEDPPGNVQVTIASSPAGSGYVTVDGLATATPQVFSWGIGSTHTITAVTPALLCGSGCQYGFASWSDGGAQSHTVTAPSTPVTYTASFQTQYYLTVQATGAGTAYPSSGWYNAGYNMQITATPSSGAGFVGWMGSGSGSYTGSVTSPMIIMNGPITESAVFAQQSPVPVPEYPSTALVLLAVMAAALMLLRKRRSTK